MKGCTRCSSGILYIPGWDNTTLAWNVLAATPRDRRGRGPYQARPGQEPEPEPESTLWEPEPEPEPELEPAPAPAAEPEPEPATAAEPEPEPE